MTPRRTNQITTLLLLVGLGAAVAIYYTAPPPPDDDNLANQFLTSKRYRRDLQVMGGKANLLASDFMDWFAARWQGRELARTVVVLTIGTTLGFRWLVQPLGPPEEEGPAAGPPPEF